MPEVGIKANGMAPEWSALSLQLNPSCSPWSGMLQIDAFALIGGESMPAGALHLH